MCIFFSHFQYFLQFNTLKIGETCPKKGPKKLIHRFVKDKKDKINYEGANPTPKFLFDHFRKRDKKNEIVKV